MDEELKRASQGWAFKGYLYQSVCVPRNLLDEEVKRASHGWEFKGYFYTPQGRIIDEELVKEVRLS